MKKLNLFTPLLAAALLLGACGSDDEPTSPSADAGAEFNDADVEFATEMIPHHAQALVMVDMTRGQDLDPELVALTEQMQAAQTTEIETMVDWLTAWEQPVPETIRDHASSEGDMGDMDMGDMSGSMTEEDLDELEGRSGSAFQDMWVTMMIEHHEGAIEMAGQEIEDGKFPDAIEMAAEIVESQTAEIEQLRELQE